MQVSHVIPASTMASAVVFDDPNLIAHAGLIPAMALAEQTGLFDLIRRHLTLTGPGSAYPAEKIAVLVAGMLAGADSIDDMDLLRHGAMGKILTELRAPSTLGTFLRKFTHGHVRQLDAVNSRLLAGLQNATTTAGSPLLPDAGELLYVDIDDTIRQTYGYAKQGASYGYTKVKGLNAMIVTATTPASAPVIVGARLCKGSTASAHGAAKLLGDGLGTMKRTRSTNSTNSTKESAGLVIVRADSAYYNHSVIAAARRAGA
ncbi:DDE family transposase [Kineococcus rhizosphaerae]|uniref:DDE family transposase n=1 Tax=Kineococcus rhizosphaerae TaxID=559628 RepID=A0A2T0QRE4_9ACTN|nr:DDE family transposase [Kineococcus rhizosphaerae]